jgi:aspartokinase
MVQRCAGISHELERHYIDAIHGMSHINIVAVVGSGMRGTPGLAARIFTAVWAGGHQRHRHRPGIE